MFIPPSVIPDTTLSAMIREALSPRNASNADAIRFVEQGMAELRSRWSDAEFRGFQRSFDGQ